ncbi:MAG: triacylglycerol lipase [Nevskia sp.]|nr:triacylglycerol lipase [Nevskia sp.]
MNTLIRARRAASSFILCALCLGALNPQASAQTVADSASGGGSGLAGSVTPSPYQGPQLRSFPAGVAVSLLFLPRISPKGANDWHCKPSAAHPYPVILVHGTYEDAYDNWALMAPEVQQAGYCVFALDYGRDAHDLLELLPGVYGDGEIGESAKQLAAFVDKVLAATGAGKANLVGHSQGGLLIRAYLKLAGGADPADPARNRVEHVVSIGGSNHGTTVYGLALLVRELNLLGLAAAVAGPSFGEQVAGSPFLQEVNAGGDTEPGIDYTVIGSRYDEIVTPYQSTFLSAGPGATVHDITVQDGCPIDWTDHLSESYDPRIIGLVKAALDPANPPPVPCVHTLPLFGAGAS